VITAAAFALALSTSAPVVSSTGTATAAVLPKKVNPIHATIHAQARQWKPVSIQTTLAQTPTSSTVIVRQSRGKGGISSGAKTIVTTRRTKNATWLVISIFPKALEKRRLHLEVRLRLVEGYVEEVSVLAVSVVDPRQGLGRDMNAEQLRGQGIEFQEESPSSGQLFISALETRAAKAAKNSGQLKFASFADKDLGVVMATWSATGVLTEN
jgi:hypothetical protein